MIQILNKADNAKYGILVVQKNDKDCDYNKFAEEKNKIINNLHDKYTDYDRKEMKKTEPICHYVDYYKKFKKTYPVLLQFESIIVKGRKLEDQGIFVDSMFLAEVTNLLLTAGHDMDKIDKSLQICTAEGTESFEGIGHQTENLKKGDIYLKDESGIISSIINGPDFRTSITKDTKRVMYFIYGNVGIKEEQIQKELDDIEKYISICMPQYKKEYAAII